MNEQELLQSQPSATAFLTWTKDKHYERSGNGWWFNRDGEKGLNENEVYDRFVKDYLKFK